MKILAAAVLHINSLIYILSYIVTHKKIFYICKIYN